MKTEQVTNQTIELYINKLIAIYGLYPLINETALKIQFDHKLYAECVLEIMRKMGLANTVKVTCYADYKYPCPTSAARIIFSLPLPVFNTSRFNSMRIQVDMRESIKDHFNAFVSAVAHELSHLVMYGTKHELQDSEIATDLCMLVFGFQDFVIKGKSITKETVVGTETLTIGYLSMNQLEYASNYLNNLRALKVTKEATKGFFKRFF